MAAKISAFILALTIYGCPGLASASPSIAKSPPSFRIYDVDRREKEMRRLIGQLSGTTTLSRKAADTALGDLDYIQRQERASRTRNGGHLDLTTIRRVNAKLNKLSESLGLREPRR